jgi:hypothetical protein
VSIEVKYSASARRYIDGVKKEDKEAIEVSVATIGGLVVAGADLTRIQLPVEGSAGRLVARVEKLSNAHHRLQVDRAEDARGGAVEEPRAGSATQRRLTRAEALRVVSAGIGGRPDLPSGKEYVRRVGGVWKGLVRG